MFAEIHRQEKTQTVALVMDNDMARLVQNAMENYAIAELAREEITVTVCAAMLDTAKWLGAELATV